MNNCLKLYLSIFLWILSNNAWSQSGSTDIFSPRFSYLSGRYNTDLQVQLTTATPGASMYYTLDGSEPDNTSQLYTGAIPVTGNGTYKTIKAVTISQNVSSLTSSATYMLDYTFNPNAPYLTNLTWANYNEFLVGNWFGYVTNPWTDDYCVKVSILPNGNYIDTTTSGCCFNGACPNDMFLPVFYYGIHDTSSLKTIMPYDILASGYATGHITIDFGVSTNEDELRYIKFMDNNNLYLEMWHHSQYGPLKYYLTKYSHAVVGMEEHTANSTPVYPNPASDFVIIPDLDSDVELLDELGRSFVIEKNTVLSVAGLPKGFYILSYRDTAGAQVKQKLILQGEL